ncbi:ribosomal protection-like ABC-F family protein [Desulfolucanica intricata]|uniref:ribosomal protection-like ABC-F family protein n=1 Tax=Desulfolucanica intricata TaxID=1285191 RepID=UPI000A549F53|nr:ABC-F type ribosomal protection protein [Desulfolucanica intricata]
MMNLHFDNLSKSYKGKTVLNNISGKINITDKIGLVGANGIGKTTLAEILSGRKTCDTGKISRSPANGKILYIEQYPVFDANISVYREIFRVAAASHKTVKDVKTIVTKALHRVKIDEKKWQQPALTLSGGEKTKLALCRAMVSDFDLLILDEPTNHLDINNYQWLEEFVTSLKQPLLVISHDRFFLDNAVNQIWELTNQGLKVYPGNYSAYKVQKEIMKASITREYNKQQIKIQHLKQVINERKNWYRSAHRSAGQNDFYRSKAKKHAHVIKAKERELARIEQAKVDKPVKAVSPAFEIINKNITGKKLPQFLLQGKDLSKCFGDKTVFEHISFNIKRGDKIALIGANGVGKTTLLKMICQLDHDYSGNIIINPSVKIGYFAQELDNLPPGSSILDEVLTQGSTVAEARLLLASLLFKGNDVYKKIALLSMGEKGRVAFAKLILSGANLLVLDEPTNYMDMLSKERIEAVLAEFTGSILFVSHDRYFIQKLANRVFVIDNRKLYHYAGDYQYYLAKCKEQKAKEEVGADYQQLTDTIRQLECELAFLGGKLNEALDEEEKVKLNERFLTTAKELNKTKQLLKK